ncbi:MAG: asparagine synthase (glutamine-hydrolyzing) [Polyangiaceae bacterium]|nr:asparagine synthase (glutamine-hydrolyzing) [Polyangiaceae bacterium]
MCGITGFWGPPASRDDREARLWDMTQSLAHRGPDSAGVWYDEANGVGLGHRRLSILDLSEQGQQPMLSSDGRWVVAYNGEIYNSPTLAEELGRLAGVRFRGHSDTEMLVEALAHWGVASALKRFVGMFAFAAFDTRQRRLYLVRDRIGIKPLYYGRVSGMLVFASELKALRALESFEPRVDREALAAYLRFGVVPGSQSIYAAIRRVRPGTFVTIDARRHEASTTFWSAVDAAAAGRAHGRRQSFDGATRELESLLREAVRDRLLSDVPLGAFLSGGIDSSLVVSLMQCESSSPVRTFTIGSEDPAYDEARSARPVAQALGTEHTELIVSAAEAQATIPRLAALFDEPFADSSQLPTFLVSQLARRTVTVCLSGDGGDELFGGYNRHLWAPTLWRRFSPIPFALRRGAAKAMEAVAPADWDRLYALLEPALPPRLRARLPGDKLHKIARILRSSSSSDAYRNLCSQWFDPSAIVVGCEREAAPWLEEGTQLELSLAEHMMLLDLVNYLPDDILTKVDRASMAVALETRVPLLDHRVVEYAWSLPLEHRIRAGVGKAALREILARHIPSELVERPKMGFGVPLGDWLRGPLRPWAEALLDEERLKRERWFEPSPIRRLWASHLARRSNAEHALWPILVFQAWLETWPSR